MEFLEELSPQRKKQLFVFSPFLAIATIVVVTGLGLPGGNSPNPVNPANPSNGYAGNVEDISAGDDGTVEAYAEIPVNKTSYMYKSSEAAGEGNMSVTVEMDRMRVTNNATAELISQNAYYGSKSVKNTTLKGGVQELEFPDLKKDSADQKSPGVYWVRFYLSRENVDSISPRLIAVDFQ